ncbi:NAD(P)H-binding protein [Bauldia litoralis]|uniref:Uncharacterized conserved protein YbjT, contains NAD(P)-binding and DUF2867 domains n=1 Tax=Bauldia litoralis TaxID=665467 RepID=A0A1G6CSZ3_9HYPH|nr:NAD(P)H-binding protein [Bauldia litoralis]SDB35952.1 Uncharacterized conserved protein YbjT, contains NAD(P)-binding and DUF2867 domains [Bauldia litoralis]
MIIVTGASGHLGHAIVENLVGRVPANQVVASVRDPEKAADLSALSVEVRHGDFDDPESLRRAFEGARLVLIVSSNARSTGGDPLAQHRAAIEAARAAGAERIIYTSQMAASPSSVFPPALDHAATEDMLRQCGVAWTSLRHGFYAASGIMLMGDALKTGVIEAPADGKIAWTAHADLAEADAAIVAKIFLGNGERFDGPTPPLTGSEALDLADLAGIASALCSRPIRRQVPSDEDFSAKLAARGVANTVASIALGLYVASRRGEFAAVDPMLERLLNRPPISMRDVIADHIAASRD